MESRLKSGTTDSALIIYLRNDQTYLTGWNSLLSNHLQWTYLAWNNKSKDPLMFAWGESTGRVVVKAMQDEVDHTIGDYMFLLLYEKDDRCP